MSASGSAKVILISLLANVGIAASKFVGAAISGSTALFAEGIHSLVDCANQSLLLFGNNQAQRPASKQHPLGYGREAFFWSFVVAILLFSLGGLFAIYEGAHKLSDLQPINHPMVGLTILAIGIVLEIFSLKACLREVARQNREKNLWAWFRKTTSSELLVIFTEDVAALVGLTIAAFGIGLAWVTGNSMWDALGSILIGVVLVLVAILLAVETKSLLIGEAPSTDFLGFVESKVVEYIPGGKVFNLIALQIGASEVMISCKLSIGNLTDAKNLVEAINQIEKAVKQKFPEVKWQFFEPDTTDD